MTHNKIRCIIFFALQCMTVQAKALKTSQPSSSVYLGMSCHSPAFLFESYSITTAYSPRTVTVALAETVGNPPLRSRTWHVYCPVWVRFAPTRDNVLFQGSLKSYEIPEFSIKIPSFSQSISSSWSGLMIDMLSTVNIH